MVYRENPQIEDTLIAVVPNRFIPGNKVYLPSSFLHDLEEEAFENPLTFRLTNTQNLKQSYCGVQEFTALPDRIILSASLARTLDIKEGEQLFIESVTLPHATHVKLKPYQNNFYQIEDPVRDLEREIGKFSCLVQGEVITVEFSGQRHDLLVEELKPASVCLVIDIELKVDFSPSFENEEKEKLEAQKNLEKLEKYVEKETSGIYYSLNNKTSVSDGETNQEDKFAGKVVEEIKENKKNSYWVYDNSKKRRLFEISEVKQNEAGKKYSLI